MPRPPPPPAAFSNTGKPISCASARASAASLSTPGEPGVVGTPASVAMRLAIALSPIREMTRAGGPMKVTPSVSQSRANSAFSERNP